jgi:hypothetical protein
MKTISSAEAVRTNSSTDAKTKSSTSAGSQVSPSLPDSLLCSKLGRLMI